MLNYIDMGLEATYSSEYYYSDNIIIYYTIDGDTLKIPKSCCISSLDIRKKFIDYMFEEYYFLRNSALNKEELLKQWEITFTQGIPLIINF